MFGELVRKARKAAGMSQKELAARTGMCQQRIAAIEQSVRPSFKTVQALKRVLDLDIATGSMTAVHEFDVRARCPVDNLGDVYAVRVFVDRLIKCEDVIKTCRDIGAGEARFQEELTQLFANALQATVETSGVHRCGVKTTVTCEAEPCTK